MTNGHPAPLTRVRATRYVEPLREGGSLPGLLEADDLGTYVVKFRGAGQGTATLVAEIVTGELARALGLAVPALALIDVDPAIGRLEPDEEVQDLLLASSGTNLAIDFLPRALGFEPNAFPVDPVDAARVLWLDALTVNVDRSWRNPNLLIWHNRLWAIDHGATLLFQHTWSGPEVFGRRPYAWDDHIFEEHTGLLGEIHDELAAQVTTPLLHAILELVPEDWLPHPEGTRSVADVRALYVAYLQARLAAAATWLPGAAR